MIVQIIIILNHIVEMEQEYLDEMNCEIKQDTSTIVLTYINSFFTIIVEGPLMVLQLRNVIIYYRLKKKTK